jgi:hypothetical protein
LQAGPDPYEQSGFGFADLMIREAARRAATGKRVTFDRKAADMVGVVLPEYHSVRWTPTDGKVMHQTMTWSARHDFVRSECALGDATVI